jgi:signal transduction histidine kinase
VKALLARIPRETKVAALVLAVALAQVGVLAAVGLGQASARREDAERAIAERAGRSMRSLVHACVRQVAAQEDRLAAESARDDLPPFDRVREALQRAPLFTTAHLVDERGEPCDVARPPIVPQASVVDAEARRALAALSERTLADPAGTAAAAKSLATEIEAREPRDAVAAALAWQCAARAALRAGDGNNAFASARRVLEGYRGLRDDRGAEGESEPLGPAASLIACEALLTALPSADQATRAAFVHEVLDRRNGAQRLRGSLSDAGYRVERADCERLRREATALPAENQEALRAGLAECDAIDAALELVRSAPRTVVLAAAAGDQPVRVPLAGGDLLVVVPLRRAGPWTAALFTAPAAKLRSAALAGEVDRADAPDGASIFVRDASGAVVAGRAPEGSAPLLREESFGNALPGLVATSVLSDPTVITREADQARRYFLWVLGGAILGVLAASLLAVRAVMREVRLARLKSDFVSNLSHELRTPLTSLRMFVDTLREGRVRDQAEAKECLDVVAQETDRLSSLVDRVLQFAAFAKGRAPIQLRSADLGDVVGRAVQLFRKRAEAAGAAIEARVDAGLPETIVDRDAIAQVVLNLLDNAVKHAGHDGARVRVSARPHPPGGGRGAAIVVEDDGPGVPERERELVFEEFYRGDDTLSRRTQGAGLGLALSRRIVLAHGGTIDVVRSPDLGGAAFRVFLPPADTGRRLAVAAQTAPPGGAPATGGAA